MEIRNRMSDVVKLRCNACQEFLKMIIQPGWQQKIYDIAKNAIEYNRYADNYRSAYEKMRDIGIENYSVDDMDVTFITQVVCFCHSVVTVHKQTKDALTKLRDDRNLTNHSSENEDAEELYLRGLLSLCNLKNFIKAVDKNEIRIDDEKRLVYRNKYIPKIEELTDILDEERIVLIQRTKDIQKNIERLLLCKDDKTRLSLWCDISKLYMDREWKLEGKPDDYHEFMIKASDAGIAEAHGNAADYYFIVKKDFIEGEKRLFMLVDSFDKLPVGEAKHIIDTINCFLMQGKALTEGMIRLVDIITAQGYSIVKRNDGLYFLEKKNK